MASMPVKVQLITSKETGEAVVVKVLSNARCEQGHHGLQRTTAYKHMRDFKGGPEQAVHFIAAILADEACERFGDDVDADQVGKAAVEAFKEALFKAERHGFGKKRMMVDEDVSVLTDYSEGTSES